MSDWDLEVKPHLTPYFAYSAAFVIAAAHIAVGFALKIGSSGVIFQTADQVAMALLGVIIGALVLLFARPRLRVGADGVAVRNLLGYRLIPWSEVVGVSFPPGARSLPGMLGHPHHHHRVGEVAPSTPWTRCAHWCRSTARTSADGQRHREFPCGI